MKLTAVVVALAFSLVGAAWGQDLALLTTHGPLLANADRVLVSADDGRWREVEGEGGAYAVQVPGARYSLAITCFGPEGPQVTVYRFPAGELESLLHACPGRGDVLSPPGRLRGELRFGAREPDESVASVHLGGRTLYAGEARGKAAFSVAVTSASEADVLALLRAPGRAPTAALIHRAVNLTAPTPIGFDFPVDDAAGTELYSLAAEPAEGAALTARLSTCGGTLADVGGAPGAAAQGFHYAALPEGLREGCDSYELTAHWPDADGRSGAVASTTLTEPADVVLVRPPPAEPPVMDTVGTDPLRARFTWSTEAGALLYLGRFTDGRVTWTFVQSASLPPAITLPPWGADPGVPELGGGAFSWSFGVVHGAATVQAALDALGGSDLPPTARPWLPATAGASYQIGYTGGTWAPHGGESGGSR